MKYFFLDENNTRKGPYSKEELLNLGLVYSDTLIWHEGNKEWRPFKEVFPGEGNIIPPAHDAGSKPNKVSFFNAKSGMVTKVIVSILILSTLFIGFFSCRYFFINSSLNTFKLTGYFDEPKLKVSAFLGSDYAEALLALSYTMEDDTLQAKTKFEELRHSKDWRAIALANNFLNETVAVEAIREGIIEEVGEGDWFWLFYKSIFEIDGKNGFKSDNKSSSLELMKASADKGFVIAMRTYADLTEDNTDKCEYYDKFIKSDYRRKSILGNVYYNLAALSMQDKGCKIDNDLFFKYANKAVEYTVNAGYYLLGIAYQNGKGVEVDNAKAFENFKKAADYGVPEAIYSLSQCYKNGVGTSQSTDNYKTTLKSASDLGFAPAVDELAEVNKREAARYNQGSIQACECCGTTFDVSYGWGYDNSSGPFRKGSSSNIARSFLAAALFGSDDSNIGLKYCRKQCAWDCN